jgi:hypothetical protein
MSTKTISEVLFEKFCEENSIRCSQIERQEYPTPDYDVYFDRHLVIAEVKQIDPNATDEALHEQVQKGETVADWEESGRRVRLKIDSAKKQLKLRSQGKYPAILVLYDNGSAGSTDRDDIKTAMYGHECLRIVPASMTGRPIIKDVGFGPDRKFTPSHNTTFSAIALLYHFTGALRLSIFHNLHAKSPINPSWLRRSTVKHFTLEPQISGTFQEWCEI